LTTQLVTRKKQSY